MFSRHRMKAVLAAMVVGIGLLAFGCAQQDKTEITEAGSTTVQPLAEKLANAFMAKHPDVSIVIQGGGSSVGVKSADTGTVDIGAASRELKESEPKLVKHLLALDGIPIIVHPNNPLKDVTIAQVRLMFAGDITNWKDLGGPDHAIVVAAREEGSGTRAAFRELVMEKPEPASKITARAILQPSNGAVRTVVAGDEHAIGFLSLGMVDKTVKALAIDGIEPTVENLKAGKYAISRPLYFLTKTEPTGLVKEFLDFCKSAEAEPIVLSEGYISVR